MSPSSRKVALWLAGAVYAIGFVLSLPGMLLMVLGGKASFALWDMG